MPGSILQCDFCPTCLDLEKRPMEMNLDRARKIAEAHGWTVVLGMDFCASCTRKLREGQISEPRTEVIATFIERPTFRQKVVPINK